MEKCIACIATFDTKGKEIKYIKDIIEKRGHRTITIDCGVLGTPAFQADITREQVAQAAGSTLEQVKATGSAGNAAEIMVPGLIKIVRELCDSGRLAGAIGIGGGMGIYIGTSAMKTMPLGMPKIMVSPKVGQAGAAAYVGTRDVTIMPSVADIEGLNSVIARVLANAAGAIVGMVEVAEIAEIPKGPIVVMSELGTTTRGALMVQGMLEKRGYDVIIFGGMGIGGRCQEDLITNEPGIVGVIEFGISEVGGEIFQASARSGPDRLESAGKRGIPQIVTPGNVDFIAFLGPETLTERFKTGHKINYHNPMATLPMMTAEERSMIAEVVAEKLNRAKGPVRFLLPLRGFSGMDIKGREYFDPDADRAFAKTLKGKLKPTIPVIEIDAHINDSIFAEKAVEHFFDQQKEWESQKKGGK